MKTLRISQMIAIVLCLLALIFLVSCSSSSDKGYDSENMIGPGISEGAQTDGSDMGDERKVIKDASVTAETKSYDSAIDQFEIIINEYDAVIYSSSTKMHASYNSSSALLRQASYVIKVPSEKFDDFLDVIQEHFNVTHINTSTKDVSDEYYDLEAVIKTLKDKREGLVDMLKNTDKSMDFYTWKQINDELTALDTQLAKYEAQMKALDGKVTYSTVNLSISEVGELTPVDEKTYGDELKEAVKESFEATVGFFKGLLIFIIHIFPFALIWGAVLIAILLALRANKRKKKAKKEAKKAENAELNNSFNKFNNNGSGNDH